ncbi:hypothetical protein BXZ70DRAFT_913858 [Cristinia sonorae]|uniref:BAG domain-containing protein n=1 Tax=Cristinia sonorae TaxID=1940300 RepID=A0A8K0UYM0_9AGAR|nr:hypothetical protein BXZ70DRAFT_913858 [Cristinia sonorae]
MTGGWSALIVVPLVLILLRLALSHAKRLFPSRPQQKQMSYVVKWGRDRLYFPLPPPDAKLAVIRRELAEYTQLPYSSFKLVHAGAVMKDDNAPISSYGIRENSTIAIIGTGETLTPSSKIPSAASSQKPAAPRTEETTITQIRTEMDKVRCNLQPDVDTFLESLSVSSKPTPTSSAQVPQSGASRQPKQLLKFGELEHEHTRLGELLLQSLLRLDAIQSEGEWEQARKERKGAVKEVQALLDRLDGGWRTRAKA